MPSDADFLSGLRDGVQAVGVLLPLSVGSLIEMSAVAGMDFILIDCEHGPVDYAGLEHAIAVAQLQGTAVFVRVGKGEPALVARALDTGATGLVFPHVNSVEDARAAVRYSRYPPLGNRGFSNYGRTGEFGRQQATQHVDAEDARTVVIAMIESMVGYAALDEILATPGIDGIMCGPADLAISPGAGDASQVAHTVADIAGRVSNSDKIELAVVGTKQAVTSRFEQGAAMVAINLAPVMMDLLEEWQDLAPRR